MGADASRRAAQDDARSGCLRGLLPRGGGAHSVGGQGPISRKWGAWR